MAKMIGPLGHEVDLGECLGLPVVERNELVGAAGQIRECALEQQHSDRTRTPAQNVVAALDLLHERDCTKHGSARSLVEDMQRHEPIGFRRVRALCQEDRPSS